MEIIGVDQFPAYVVRRVEIDHFYLARVALLEELQDFEVVPLDHEVLGRFPVHAVLGAGAQGAGGRGEGELPRETLAVPVQAVLLIGVGDALVAH